MTILSAAKAILEADSTLLATATGGVWDYGETDRQGLNRTTTPAAFDSNGIIKPSVLLKVRNRVPDGAIADDTSQEVSYRQVLEAWLYEDTGYSNINTMSDRVYSLLHGQALTGAFEIVWNGDLPGRDPDLDANFERVEYLVHALRST